MESVDCLHLDSHWETKVAADCQSRELLVCVCDECGKALEGCVGDKAEHSLVYTDNADGTHTYGCSVCDHVEEEGQMHTFIDGICVCGAVLAGVRGDMNGDGDVDAEDLTLLARHVAGIEVSTDPVVLKNADVDGNGEIEASDLTLHARYVAGIITDWDQDT